jgi:hypothetical protein
MSNKGGKSQHHGITKRSFPSAANHKKNNKRKANERKETARTEWQEMLKGI